MLRIQIKVYKVFTINTLYLYRYLNTVAKSVLASHYKSRYEYHKYCISIHLPRDVMWMQALELVQYHSPFSVTSAFEWQTQALRIQMSRLLHLHVFCLHFKKCGSCLLTFKSLIKKKKLFWNINFTTFIGYFFIYLFFFKIFF